MRLLPLMLLFASASAASDVEAQADEGGATGYEGKRFEFEGGTREEFQEWRDRFELWTGCKPVTVHLKARIDSERVYNIYSQNATTSVEGLSKARMDNPKDHALINAIATAFESRLRGARLFAQSTAGGNTQPVHVRIDADAEEGQGTLYGAQLELVKDLLDPLSGWHSHETTYDSAPFYGYTSELGRWRSELESWAARAADRFIADYLRANDDACNGAQSTPSPRQ